MVMTNAERQRAWRERHKGRPRGNAAAVAEIAALKARIAELERQATHTAPPDEDEPDPFLDLIRAHYLAGARAVAFGNGADSGAAADIRESAWSEFLQGDLPSWISVLGMAEDAGAKAWVDIFERLAREWAASLPPLPEPPPPEPQPTKRRRRVTA